MVAPLSLVYIQKFTFRNLNISSISNSTFSIIPLPATITYVSPSYQTTSQYFQNQKRAKFLRKQTYSSLKSKLKLQNKKAELFFSVWD